MTFYTYRGKIVKIIDGDTIDVIIDLGFEVQKRVRCRLDSVDAPAITTPEGKKAKEFLVEKLPINETVTVVSNKYDKYGRSVAMVYYNDVNINQLLLDNNHAVVYKK